jgi:molecular chaperone DnaK
MSMARLGVDFGTTNTVVVASDRGRYPLVPQVVETSIGQVMREVFPSLMAYEHATGRLLYGSEAERCLARPDAERQYGAIRSVKRLLRDYAGGGRVGREVCPDGFDTAEVLTGFATALRESVLRSSLFAPGEPLQAVITWPANANGAQRYVTRACFRDAGFEVIGTLNEPTAAAIEFADRVVRGNRMAAKRLSRSLAVFDFGGGTFDASVVKIEGGEFTVVDAVGIEDLGGDDLDDVLARLFAERLGIDLEALPASKRDALQRHACQQKESIALGATRSLTLVPSDIGLPGATCRVSVAEYLEQLRAVIAPTVESLWALVNGSPARDAGIGPETLDAVYLVGGSSKLPLVTEMISARLPTARLVMSDKPFTATAMGAAIHSAEEIPLREILSRHFGVLRLADHGSREYFAPIFPAGVHLPPRGGGPLQRTIEYSPRHNIGHLRFFECAAVDDVGRPAVGVRAWSDVLFPYDPSLQIDDRLMPATIAPREDLSAHVISETYVCDSDGVIAVHVSRRSDGQRRSYEIFRPGEPAKGAAEN